MNDRNEALVDEALALINQVELVLHGKPRELQGGVLCDLVARHFLQYPPAERPQAMKEWSLCFNSMLIINERIQKSMQ